MTTYYEFKRFEETAERLGLRIGHSRHSYAGGESVSIFPTEKWVIYANDFEMWSGSIEGMMSFMNGLERGLHYAEYLGWKREQAEKTFVTTMEKQKQRHEHQRLAKILTDGKDLGVFVDQKIKN